MLCVIQGNIHVQQIVTGWVASSHGSVVMYGCMPGRGQPTVVVGDTQRQTILFWGRLSGEAQHSDASAVPVQALIASNCHMHWNMYTLRSND